MNTTFDPDRDKALGITGGPQPKQNKREWLTPFLFIAPVVLAAVLTFAALKAFGSGEEVGPTPARPEASPAPAAPAVVDPNPGLNRETLKGLASAVATAWYVDKDPEKAQFILQNASVLAQPCRVFVSSGFHEVGDLEEKAVRERAKKLAEQNGATIVFDHSSGTWVGAAQICS